MAAFCCIFLVSDYHHQLPGCSGWRNLHRIPNQCSNPNQSSSVMSLNPFTSFHPFYHFLSFKLLLTCPGHCSRIRATADLSGFYPWSHSLQKENLLHSAIVTLLRNLVSARCYLSIVYSIRCWGQLTFITLDFKSLCSSKYAPWCTLTIY